MAGTPLTAGVCNIIIKSQQAAAALAPLAGVTAQDATPYTSAWMPVPAACCLQLALNLVSLVGNIGFVLETVANQTDPPRFLQSCLQPGAAPATVNFMTGPTDNFVRVIATPGTGGGQLATWSITGKAIAAPFASTT
jgi:hypothetical protein